MRADADDLTMLLVAEGERLAPALRERLVKHGLNVHDCTRATVADTAFVVAPDLVVLAGLAAEDGGLDVLAALAARPATAGLPVVLIGDPARLGERASSFRHGVVAIVEHTASADELARRIAEVAHELPERTGEASGAVDAGGVQALVELLAESLRTGILSVTGPDGVTARVVLRADRPASEVIAQIVERLRPLADAQSGVRYEFHESPTGKLGALDLGRDDDAAALAELPRSRLLLIEQNPARADLLAQGLRAHGARVAVADGLGRGLELARELTPDVVVVDGSAVDGSAVDGWALEALRKIRRDPWLRWASLLLVEASRLWRDERRPDVTMLAASIESLMRSDRELVRRLLIEMEVGTRLEVLGPVRTLRALAETKLGLRMRVQHPRVIVDVDLSDGIVVGASARLPNAKDVAAEGPAAMATLLGLSSGRVQIERAEAPRSTNIMAPVDDAIASAADEEPVVARSQPPPSLVPPAPTPTLPAQSRLPREAGDVAQLVAHLEQLLGELRTHAEPSPAVPLGAATPPPAGAPNEPTPRASLTMRAPAPPPPVAHAPPLSEETTSTVGLEEIARLRRQMRDSSQRLRAVQPPPPAALPAPPVRSRKQTLVGLPVDVVLPPAMHATPPPTHAAAPAPAAPVVSAPPAASSPVAAPSVAAPFIAAPPSPVAKPPLRAPVAARIPPPGLPPAKLPPLTPPAVKLPPPKVAAPPPATIDTAPGIGLPERAQPSPLVAPAIGSIAAQPPGGVLGDGGPADPNAEDSDVGDSDVGDLDVGDLDVPHSVEHDFPDFDVAELDAPPTQIAAPNFFSLAGSGPSPAAPPSAQASVPVARSPLPLDGDAHPHLSASDETPFPAQLVAPAPRSKLPLAIAAAFVALALLSVLAIVAWRRFMPRAVGVAPFTVGAIAPSAPPTPTQRTSPSTPIAAPSLPTIAPPSIAPEAALPSTATRPAAAPTVTTPVAAPPASPTGALGPGPAAPLEGSDADFDLARLGIAPAPAPTNRRVRMRLFARLQRQANQARRQHHLDEAQSVYVHLLGMDPENGRGTAGLSLIYLERNQPAEAILWAQRLVRLQSIAASHWVLLGDTLRAGNNHASARRAYARALIAQARYAPAQGRLQALTDQGH